MAAAVTKIIFCSGCQADTDHTFTVSHDDYVATCDTCGRFDKFPTNITAVQLKELLDAHKQANLGQVPAVEITADHPALKLLEEI